jgi:hypothetical protein
MSKQQLRVAAGMIAAIFIVAVLMVFGGHAAAWYAVGMIAGHSLTAELTRLENTTAPDRWEKP